MMCCLAASIRKNTCNAIPGVAWDGGLSSQACACEQASEHARAHEAMGPHGPRPVEQRPLGSCIGDGSEQMWV